MSTCNKTSNNKYFDCPARMNDGRTFTDYRPSCTVDDMIRYSNNVMGSFEYRQFLIHNATSIMNVNNQYTQDKVGMSNCNTPEVPFQTVCDINNQYSKCSPTGLNGIGIKNIINANVEHFAAASKHSVQTPSNKINNTGQNNSKPLGMRHK
jgi:hypothetical protein